MSDWYQFNPDEDNGCQCNIKFISIKKINYFTNENDPSLTDYQLFYLNRRENVTLNSTDSTNFMDNFNAATNGMVLYRFTYKNINTILVLDGLEFLCNNLNEIVLFYNYNTIYVLFDTAEEALPVINEIKTLLNF